MQVERRKLIKGLGMTSLLSLLQSSPVFAKAATPKGANTPDGKLNVLVHGFFFMYFEGGKLCLITPPFGDHELLGGIRGLAVPLPRKLDFSTGLLQNGPVADFSALKKIARFSTGNIGPINETNGVQVILPQPDEIEPLRLGKLDDFRPVANSSIGKQIKSNSDGSLALVTCLRYSVSLPVPINCLHLYAQPKTTPDMGHVNDALQAAKPLFQHGENFDLQMDASYTPNPVPIDSNPGYGVDPADEYGLDESNGGEHPRGLHVGNCLTFALAN